MLSSRLSAESANGATLWCICRLRKLSSEKVMSRAEELEARRTEVTTYRARRASTSDCQYQAREVYMAYRGAQLRRKERWKEETSAEGEICVGPSDLTFSVLTIAAAGVV